MSKINQMEKALQEIDATKFHKLIDSYLSKSYSYKITSNGTKLAEDKPTKGTPDSFAVLENGKYIFIEYTTQKTNIKNKFLDDIGKCFDEEKTGIKVTEIEKIVKNFLGAWMEIFLPFSSLSVKIEVSKILNTENTRT